MNGLPCPRGDLYSSDDPRRYLPSGIGLKDVYKEYVKQRAGLFAELVSNHRIQVEPTNLMTEKSFGKIWREKYPCLRLSKGKTDYCNTCAYLNYEISTLSGPSKLEKQRQLADHRRVADAERNIYNSFKSSCIQESSSDTIHLVMDFAEKVLLPSMQDQPGSLHYVTGLKFDIFGISSSNDGKTFLFGLPEGYWTGDKGANEVLSMVMYAIRKLKDEAKTSSARRLVIHADNCGGQNKNRWVLWFCAMLTICNIFDEVTLHFLIAGHTKNVCDGAFGNVKKLFRVSDVYNPRDMMNILREGSTNSKPVFADEIKFQNWKDILEEHFKYPQKIQISRNHVFGFSATSPGFIETKEYSFSVPSKPIYLLCSENIPAIRVSLRRNIFGDKFNCTWATLAETILPKSKRGNRLEYIRKHILQPYFPNDPEMQRLYLADGRGNDGPI